VHRVTRDTSQTEGVQWKIRLKTEAKAQWKWKMFNRQINSIWSLIMI